MSVRMLLPGLSVVLCLNASAITYHVTAGRTPSGSEQGTPENPFSSIQQAVRTAATNDSGDGFHIIQVAPGIYNCGEEESPSTNMEGSCTVQSLIHVPTNTFLNGLRILGSGPEATIVDAGGPPVNRRVMRIDGVGSNGVTVSGMTLRGGRFGASNSSGSPAGQGLWATATNLVMEDVRVTGCHSSNSASRGVVHVQGGNARLTRVQVDSNQGVRMAVPGAGVYVAGDGFRMANSRIENNAPGYHGLIWSSDRCDGRGVVFGTLIANNGQGGVATAYQAYETDRADRLYLVHCSIVDNGGYGACYVNKGTGLLPAGHWNLNTLYSGNDQGVRNMAGVTRPFRYLGCLIDDSKVEELPFTFSAAYLDGYSGSDSDDGSNTVGAEPVLKGPRPWLVDKAVTNGTATRINVAASGPYAVGQRIEINLDGVARPVTALGAGFIEIAPEPAAPPSATDDFLRNWGSCDAVPGTDYSLTGRSPAVDKGAALHSGPDGCLYVDVDNDDSYDAGLDVIVALNQHLPAVSDWVVTADLAGNRRCRLRGIDVGAYEYRLPPGTVVSFH